MGENVSDYGSLVTVVQVHFDHEEKQYVTFDTKTITHDFTIKVIEACPAE
jgi:hypothetical protein